MMRSLKTIITTISIIILSIINAESVSACTGGTSQGAITPTANWQTMSGTQGGEYWTFVGVAGRVYIFSFCQGGASYVDDPQIQILNNAGVAIAGAYNDDHCGLGSELIWVCPSGGTYRVAFYEFNCQSSGTALGTFAYCYLPTPTRADCLGARPLCTTNNTVNNLESSGSGHYWDLYDYTTYYPNMTANDNNCPDCIIQGENYSNWYTFYAQTSGSLTFSITPQLAGQDFDWAVWDMTGRDCNDLANGTAWGYNGANSLYNPLSCNYCGNGGSTGLNLTDAENCEQHSGSCDLYNRFLNVTAGRDYVLFIDNYSGTTNGYSVNFGGTASIIDQTPPLLSSIVYPPVCGSSSITVQFSEAVSCLSMQNSCITVTGPGGVNYPISDIWSHTCISATGNTYSAGTFYDDVWTIDLTNELMANGAYTVSLTTGCATDLCGNGSTGPSILNFNIVAITATLNLISHAGCPGQTNGQLSVTGVSGGTAPYTYHWSTGSTASSISGLGAGTYSVTVTDAIGRCEWTASETIYAAPPINPTASSNTPVCAGSTINLYGGSSTGTGYSWSGPGGFTSGLEDPTRPTATTAMSGTYTLTVTDAYSCTATTSTVVTVNANPVGATQATPINVGTLGCSYSNIQNNCVGNCFTNDGGQSSDDIYYMFTLANAATVNISHCGSGFDTYLRLLNNVGTQIAFNDDNGPLCAGTAASIQIALAAGTYYVVSEGYSSNCGNINTQIGILPPTNDNCANAIAIGAFPYSSGVMSNQCATNDVPASQAASCDNHYNNVWFTFIGTGNNITISTVNGSTNFDTELHVYTGACGAQTEVACNDDFLGVQSQTTFCTVSGTTYYVSVGAYGSSGYGNYVLSVIDMPLSPPTAVSATPNPICAGSSTTLSGTIGTNGNGISWYTGGCGGTLVGTGTSLSVTPAVTTTYYARTTGACGNVSATCTSVTVTVNPPPTITCPPLYTVPGCNGAIPAGANTPAAFIALGGATNATGISYSDAAPTMSGCTETTIRTYTATLAGCTSTCTQTLRRTVVPSGPVVPANGSSTVSCPASAVAPATPAVNDACGSSITPVLVSTVNTPNPLTCEGTRTYNYTYTDCAGNSAPWSYTYTVNYSGGLTAPANGASTVSCPAAAVNPGAPANITDACGRTVSAVLVGSTDVPNPVTCEGTRVWRYRYTDCDGTTTADWTYTYTINYSGGLTPPANGSSTVSCPAAAVNPGAPANILDACGRTVVPVLIGSADAPNPVTCEGTRIWTYRYTDCDGTTTADWTYTYTINYSGGLTAPANGASTVSCPAAAVNPGAPANITDACGRTVVPVLIGSTDAPNPVTCEGSRVWTYRYTDCDGTTTADWTYSYTINYSGGLTPPANGASTVSCPANAVNPGAPANITDACGRTVVPVLIGSTDAPNPVTCEGTRVWTYRYTDCDGTTTADWTYTYSINYSGGLTPPANGASTVNCPANATDPGAPANITDACGRTVIPVLVGSTQVPNPVTCNGTVVWTYRYTACDGTTADWTYTYTVSLVGGLTPPANGSSTVSCPVAAVNPGAPANILDACGRTLSPVLIGSTSVPSPVTCEGTTVWTYRYTACDGTTADWTYTYTVDFSGGLTPPANGSSTVSCPANATDPGAPANITDACGRTVVPALIGSTDVPNPVTCEGTRVWIYRYTACDGTTTADWTYTYTIDYSGALTPPANGSFTVSCPANATDPGAPANITDACGRTVVPVLIGSTDVPNPVTCDGTRVWTYRYTACDGTTTADWTYTYTIVYSGGLTAPANGASTVNCPANATDPGAPANITDACGRTVVPVLVGSTQIPNPVTCNGNVVWTYRYTACDGTTADWTHTYTVSMVGGLTPPANGSSTVSCPAAAVNPGSPANILDACGRTLAPVLIGSTSVPSPVTCEGTTVWTYRYTACDGTIADWTYTYTIDYSGGLTPPANGSSTVSCPANATDPGAPANITDACGRTVVPALIGSTDVPNPVTCEGTRVWTYRYTACDGTTTADWTYTYTIDYSGALTPPANGSSTVSCPANATDPGAPANITDACGRTVVPVLIGSTDVPNPVTCDGTRVWTYRYTACDGTTTADWTYTYTIDNNSVPVIPVDGSSTVQCVADAIAPVTPVVVDACGNNVPAVLASIVDNPNPLTCEGTRTYTYTYTDCAANVSIWNYVYTIDNNSVPVIPANGSSTVLCIAGAVAPVTPIVTDACGNNIPAVLASTVNNPNPLTCEGIRVYTYTYTDCAANVSTWTYTYTVDLSSSPIVPANGSSTVQCIASAIAPVTPVVVDACGNNVPAVLVSTVDNPNPLTCEGTRVYTYNYTDCAGNVTPWTYTYTVDISTAPVVPADGAATVTCPVDAIAPVTPIVVDACGNNVPAVLVGTVQNPNPVTCAGTITWTYSYTDCGSNVTNWNYVYTISNSFVPVVPANQSSTVTCIANAVAPVTPVVTDACANNIPAVLVSTVDNPNPLTCEGTRVYTYTYTDCAANVSNWTYTYTIDNNSVPIIPADGSSTVQCIADAVAPVTPVVVDACGNNIPAVLASTVDNPNPLTCEGTRTYTYTYTDCAANVSTSNYVYTIDNNSVPVIPANGSSTVMCIADAVAPVTPVVTDACGNNIPAVLASTVDNPNPLTCEGTRVYTYTYTDCAANISTWTYTYTVDVSTAPIVPANGSSTVECIASAIAPVTPIIVDACGNNVPAVLVSTVDNPNPLTCEGTRVYTYNYTDCAGNVTPWTYTYTVDISSAPVVPADDAATVTCPVDAIAPVTPIVVDACGNNVPAVLVGTVQNPNPVTCAGTITWTYSYTDCGGNVTNWNYVYTISNSFVPVVPANQSSTVTCIADAVAPVTPVVTDACGNNIPADLLSVVDNPNPLTCEGTRVYTYTYTDCAANVSNWTYTYTIDNNSVPVIPADGSSTVQCIANAIAPVTPVVVDACGNNVPAVLASTVDNPNPLTCEGTRTYTYTYTDCAANVSTWNYVYTIDNNSVPVIPANGSSTVMCIANAVAPVTPVVVDACGNNVPAVLASTVDNPNPLTCEGTRVYTYTYTDCAANVSTWTYTYTVDLSLSPVAPANGSSTVECIASAIAPVTPIIVDACGNNVPAVLVSTVDNPNPLTCEGTRVYTYNYTDCAGNVTPWTYTYTVDISTAPVVPADGAATVTCPVDAIAPVTPIVVDACGNNVPAVLVGTVQNPNPVTCAGTITWTYSYTDCGGNVTNWNYVYTISNSFVPVVPANQSSTVTCIADAVAPVTPVVTDACGNNIPAVLLSVVDNPNPLTCEGTRVYTYTYTDCAANVSNWTYTYTIDNNSVPVIPADGSSTVQCIADAVAPVTPVVVDACGNNIPAVLASTVDNPNPLTCEGTRTYTYTYTDCAANVSTWNYVYTIDNNSVPVIPANGSSTVMCIADAVAPVTPVVVDACGNNIPAVLASTVDNPNPLTCEGTRVYTYTYTDCAANVSTWTYTYTVDLSSSPIVPANGSSTVECIASAIAPVTPIVVDACGNNVPAVLVSTVDNPNPLTCEGTRVYTYNYTDCAGNVTPWTYTYTVDISSAPVVPADGASTVTCPVDAIAPVTPVVTDFCGNNVPAVLVGTVQNPNPVSCAGTITWTYSYTDCGGNVTNWNYVYTISNSFVPVVPANQSSTVTCIANAVAPVTPVVTDACANNIPAVLVSTVDNPNPLTCEGTRVYTYTYTDCAANVSNWTYTYTIDNNSAPVIPADGSSTVQCVADAIAPVTPVVVDACGNNVPAVLASTVDNPNPLTCEGTRTYTYTYTDCAANVSTWNYVYTIDNNSVPVIPANGSSTVMCIADAVAPVTPVVTDACGNNIPAVLASTVDNPNPLTCEGTRVYTYTYTDCAANVSTWTYIYTVDLSSSPVVPANGSSTVQCIASAIAPVTPIVVDACGNNVPAVLISTVDNPNPLTCEGTRVYTYNFTDCAGNVTPWTYTYTVDISSAPVVPADGAATVTCPVDAIAPVTPMVVDACGNNVPAVLVGTVQNPNPVTCAGTITWTYSYTDCGGNLTNWNYVYTISNSFVPVVPANQSSTVTCIANAVAPVTPLVTDACANNIPAVLLSVVDNPNPLTCEGTRVYTYTYTDCAANVSNWTYTYTIDNNSAPVIPADGSSTVQCVADAIAPVTPVVVDACGNNVPAVLASSVDNPNPLTCEGTRTYTYTYTDCAANVSTWNYVYTIDNNSVPVIPADGSSTVMCIADAVAPVTPVVTDACGNNIPAVLASTVDNPNPLTCEGTRVYTYTYTDCAANISTWTYTYTVDVSAAPIVPANGSSTVECIASAIAPVTPIIVDACGNNVPAVLISTVDNPNPLTCEGTRVYTYNYTDCAGNVTPWTYTYTVDISSAPVVPADGAATVTCPVDAIAPVTPIVVDACGNNVPAVLVGTVQNPNPVTCAGTITWTYSYTDCGSNVTNWNYVYTISNSFVPVVPANQSSTVTCIANAVAPVTPVVTDACGNNIPAVLVSTVDNPNPLTCEGTRVYTYSYTDCAANVSNWTYTYTIDNNSAPVIPADGSSTVQCIADAIAPVTPVVVDACGNNIPAVLASTVDNPNPLTCEGTRTYTYTYTDCAANVSTWNYVYTIDNNSVPVIPANGSSTVMCIADAVAPVTPVVTDACGNNVPAVLASTVNNPNPLTCEGTRVYTYTYTDCAANVSTWTYTYTVDVSTAPIVPANGSSTVECIASAIAPVTPIIVDACGNNVPAVLVSTVDNPNPLTCEGTRVYTYNYTDCAGNVTPWTYTYTVDISSAPVVPADGSSTVQCISLAIAPVTPIVTDFCGNSITPALISTVDNPNPLTCEGIRTYNYRYTDCGGNFTDWTYTYTIDLSTLPVIPANGSSVVECISAAIAPTTPVVTDFCGNNIPAVLVSMVDNPNPVTCEGTRAYTYSYTDCSGNIVNWTYTYSIDRSTLPVVPANGASVVACVADAFAPTTPIVSDVCGNILTAVLVSTIDSPNPLVCAGSRTYNYTYTDCSGVVSNWSYVYTISDPIITVTCPADQTFDAEPGDNYTIPQLITADNCSGGFNIAWSISGTTVRSGVGNDASGLFNVGISVIDWTVTDNCGNVHNCSTIVEVIMPIAICPTDFTICADAGQQLLSSTGESPAGGVFSGTGVVYSGGLYYFNPVNSAGVYNIIYTWENVNGYQATCNFNITVKEIPDFTITNINDPLCYNGSDGNAQINVLHGLADYDIDWGTGSGISSANNYNITGLNSGSYNVIVTDANGCTFEDSFTLNNPAQLGYAIGITSDYNGHNTSCYNSDDGSAEIIVTGGTLPLEYLWSVSASSQTNAEATNLAAGTHSVTVTDANSCTVEASITIEEPTEIEILTEINNHVSCNGLMDGSATATATGGTPLYSYQWDDPMLTADRYATHLPAGTWTVVVTDANSCTMDKSVIITEPNQLTGTINGNDVRCYDENTGSAHVIVSGGTPDYDYLWNDPSASTTQSLSNLLEGNYTCLVTDANSCTLSLTVYIDEPELLTANCMSSPVVCGGVLGTAQAFTTGGNGSNTYLWTGGGNTAQINNLISGNYEVTVTDGLGCTAFASVNVGTQGNITLAISEQVPISCFGYSDAQLAVSSSDGAQPISYTWPDNSSNYIYSNVSAGYYFVTATDNWGCTGSTGYTLTQPSQIMVSFITENVRCFGGNNGSVEAIAIGGTQPYNYQWSNNMYSDSIYNLVAGQYPVTISDSHSCSTSAIASVTQPDQPLSLISAVSNVSCFGEDDGTINTETIGGTSPYTWLWSYGIYNSTSSNLSGLYSGSYYVHINDINNCSFDTTFILSEPAPIDASYIYSNPSCLGNNDGQISVEVVGGTVPYLFVWNGGASPVPEISGLIQGTYLITITDNNLCSYEMNAISLEDVDKDCIEIPNAFTPNADGVNDTWIIENIHMFPSAYIHVYNRWGQVVFESKGLDDPWDGTYNGKFVPAGVYIYIIDLYNRTDTYTGTVTIVY